MPVTLPIDVVRGLREIDRDLARAIVRLFETAVGGADEPTAEVQLMGVGDRQLLIVVDASVIRTLPGVDIIPVEGRRAFLALAPGRRAADLELAVIDRLGEGELIDPKERRALERLRQQLRTWREDSTLRFHNRTIVVVEKRQRSSRAKPPTLSFNPAHDAALMPFARQRSLIVVNSKVIRKIPGVDILPLGNARGLLALAPGRVVSDLEVAIGDRAGRAIADRERRALNFLRSQLRSWRQQAGLALSARSILIVESLRAAGGDGSVAAAFS